MNTYIPNIPDIDKKRIVIIGGGFAGLKFVRKMVCQGYQIVILDKNNYPQFQPLLYQVATSGLEPSAISFPFRKILQNFKHTHFRIASLIEIFKDKNEIQTSIGKLKYDYLILAMGATTNFFGQKNIEKFSLSMKTSADAIFIRNTILQNFENSLLETDSCKIDNYLNIVLVGGGPTGVELAGALAEMKKYIFPKDYPELDLKNMHIALYEASPKLLTGMSNFSSEKALSYLKKLGVEVYLNTSVTDYNGEELFLSDGTTIRSKTVVWSAGVIANTCKGIDPKNLANGNRIIVDRYNRIKGFDNIFVLGDQCYMETPLYPKGHPQVAQTAIQQALNLANNISRMASSKAMKEFEYKDKGSMATIGRNLAVADLPSIKLGGFIAWLLWSVVHLFTIVGIKNKLSTFLNWLWSYFTYDQSLRILIIPKKNSPKSDEDN